MDLRCTTDNDCMRKFKWDDSKKFAASDGGNPLSCPMRSSDRPDWAADACKCYYNQWAPIVSFDAAQPYCSAASEASCQQWILNDKWGAAADVAKACTESNMGINDKPGPMDDGKDRGKCEKTCCTALNQLQG